MCLICPTQPNPSQPKQTQSKVDIFVFSSLVTIFSKIKVLAIWSQPLQSSQAVILSAALELFHNIWSFPRKHILCNLVLCTWLAIVWSRKKFFESLSFRQWRFHDNFHHFCHLENSGCFLMTSLSVASTAAMVSSLVPTSLCGFPLGNFCTRSRIAYFPATQDVS